MPRLKDELADRGLRADIARTRQATKMLTSEHLASPGEAFGGCHCSECVLIGRHLEEWVEPDIREGLGELGLDPRHPIEAIVYGTLGKEPVLIEIQYVGVCLLDGPSAQVAGGRVAVDAGNHAPRSFTSLPMPAGVDETRVYTLTLRLAIDANMKQRPVVD